jgi:RNA polymerase sigma-70 factor (ECF subfamily)
MSSDDPARHKETASDPALDGASSSSGDWRAEYASPRAESPSATSTDNTEQLETIYNAHRRALYNYVLRQLTLGDRQRAEDIVQETMLRAWRHVTEFTEGKQSSRPWLFTVARRLAIDDLRARAVRPQEVSDERLEHRHHGEDQLDPILLSHHVRHAVAQLSEPHRTVLFEIYFRDRTPAEVAEELHIPIGTVKSRIHYALRTLRTVLDNGQPPR